MLVAIATPNVLDPVALSAASASGIVDTRLAGQNVMPRTDGRPDVSYVSVIKMVKNSSLGALRQTFGPNGLYGMCEDDCTFWRFYALIVASLDVPRGSIWKHHANGYYEILTVANLLGDSAGKFRPTVLYRNIDNGNEFARTTDQFFEKFDFCAFSGEEIIRDPVQMKGNSPINDIGAVINKSWSIKP